jgi:hypothetical protein
MKRRILKTLPTIELNSESGKVTPFYETEQWYQNFVKFVCFSDQTNRNLILESENAIQFLAMRIIRQKRLCGLIETAKLESLTNYYSPYYGVTSISKSQKDYSVDHEAIISKFKPVFKCFHQIDLNPLIESEMNEFRQAFKQLGFYVSSYVCSTNWYEDEIIDVADYWSRRRSKLKNTIRRRRDKVDKSGQHHFVIYKSGDLLKPLADFHHVYFKSWKVNEPFPAFIDQVAQNLMEEGKLRIGVAYENEKPVAAQMWFVDNDTAYIFKLAHCPEAEKLSLGSLLTAEMVNYVIKHDHVNKIDFLTGNDNYKKDWMTKSRPLYRLLAFNVNTFQGKMGALKSYLDKDQQT